MSAAYVYDAVPGEQCRERAGGQVVGADAGEGSVEAAERGADPVVQEGGGHAVHLLSVRNANVCALNEHDESTPRPPPGSTATAILGR